MSRAQVLEQFPDLLAILDATNWKQFKPENFLHNRLSYSAYKHMNVFQAVLGKYVHPDTSKFAEVTSCISRFE